MRLGRVRAGRAVAMVVSFTALPASAWAQAPGATAVAEGLFQQGRDLMKAGKVTPVIDRCYSLGEVPEAIRYLEEKHARGKVVVTLE